MKIVQESKKTTNEDANIFVDVRYEKTSNERVTICIPQHMYRKPDGSLDKSELEEYFYANELYLTPDHVNCMVEDISMEEREMDERSKAILGVF